MGKGELPSASVELLGSRDELVSEALRLLGEEDLFEIGEEKARELRERLLSITQELSSQIDLTDNCMVPGPHEDLYWLALWETQKHWYLENKRDAILDCRGNPDSRACFESAYIIHAFLRENEDLRADFEWLVAEGRIDVGATAVLIDPQMAGPVLAKRNIELPETLGIPAGNIMMDKDVFGHPAGIAHLAAERGLVLMNSRGLPDEYSQYPLLWLKDGDDKILYLNLGSHKYSGHGGYANFPYVGTSDIETHPEDPYRNQRVPKNDVARNLQALRQYLGWYERFGKGLEDIECQLGILCCGVDFSAYQPELADIAAGLNEYLPQQHFQVATFSETLHKLIRMTDLDSIPVVEADCFAVETTAGNIRAEESLRTQQRAKKERVFEKLKNTEFASALACVIGGYEYPEMELSAYTLELLGLHAHDAEGCHIDPVAKEIDGLLEYRLQPGLEFLRRRALTRLAAGKEARVNQMKWDFSGYGVINPFDREYKGLLMVGLTRNQQDILRAGGQLEAIDEEEKSYGVDVVEVGGEPKALVCLNIPAGCARNIILQKATDAPDSYPQAGMEKDRSCEIGNGKLSVRYDGKGSVVFGRGGKETRLFLRDVGNRGDSYTREPILDGVWESDQDGVEVQARVKKGYEFDEMEVIFRTSLPEKSDADVIEEAYRPKRSKEVADFEVKLTVWLGKDSDRADIHVVVDNRNIKDHMLQAVFETSGESEISALDFGRMKKHATDRTDFEEFALQRFDDGLIVLKENGSNVLIHSKGTGKSFTLTKADGGVQVGKTLFCSAGLLSRDDHEIAIRPGKASGMLAIPDAQEQTILEYDLALEFAESNSGDNGALRRSQQFRQPLIVGPVIEHDRLVAIKSFMQQLVGNGDEAVLVGLRVRNGLVIAEYQDAVSGRLFKNVFDGQ